MVSNTVDIGARGRWQIWVTQESQSLGNNTSSVRVRGRLFNDGTSTSFNNGGVSVSISGEDSWSGSTGFSVPAGGVDTVIDRTFTVPHNSDGYKTVAYRVSIGNTGTTTFGGGGSVAVSLALDRIPKVPDRVGTPTRDFVAPNDMIIRWNDPANNGSTIDNYEIEFDNNGSDFPSPGSRWTDSGAARSYTIFNLVIDTKYWFRVRAHNARGWGPWSSATSYTIPNVPGRPGAPTLTLRPPDDILVDWTAPDNGGASINGYQIQADNSSSFPSPVTQSTVSATSFSWITSSFGQTLWFRVRARNSQGWGDWSTSRSILIVSGPRVNVAGVWRNTVAYVNVGGVWKVAVPYVNVGGVWKIAGG